MQMQLGKNFNKLLHSKYVLYGILLILIINILGYLRIRKNKICEGARTIGKRTMPIRKLTTKRDISTRDINGRSYGKITTQMKIIPGNTTINPKWQKWADKVTAILEDGGSSAGDAKLAVAKGDGIAALQKMKVDLRKASEKAGYDYKNASFSFAPSRKNVAIIMKNFALEVRADACIAGKGGSGSMSCPSEPKKTFVTKEQKIQSVKFNKGIEVVPWKWSVEPTNINKMKGTPINNGENGLKQPLMYYVPSSNFDSDKYSTNMFLNKLSLKKQGELLSI
jgi:hypothetical protein